MIRSFFAFAMFFLSVALLAQAPANDLETIAVQVMTKAYQVADYETVEALFDKLSPENKKKFLHEREAKVSSACIQPIEV